jgi:hypothetical protein
LRYSAILSVFILGGSLSAAVPLCPAGRPLGGIQVTVKRTEQAPPLPLGKVNRIEEGDRILYAPSLRPNEKRSGKVAIVLFAAVPRPDEPVNFEILDAEDAAQPAQWKAPFRASLALYVYAPSGMSTRKLKGFLAKDQELVAQLADYAEKTAQTEAVLQAIAGYEQSQNTENLGAALHGFAGQYGISSKIDRSAPLNEQTLAALRTLNPALSSYDPISPSGTQRVSQTAGLAATVAGMFLGSTVGLAAGGTALGLNLKTLLFPDTDFRSAYSQAANQDGSVALCTSRDSFQSRKKIAYLWAVRIPDAGPPQLKIDPPNHLPAGLKSSLPVSAPEGQWKLTNRVREWALVDQSGVRTPVQVTASADQRRLEINLGGSPVRPGKYKLAGAWDWDSFHASGDVYVDPLSSFETARLTQDTQNRLQQHSGKQIVTVSGGDFQFVEKAVIVRKGDKYAAPAPVPFSLPRGPRQGPQDRLEMQVDTAGLGAGDYSLLLYQADGNARTVDVKVLPPPPKIENLPVMLNEGERDQKAVLEGEGLERITALAADGLEFALEDAGTTKRRVVQVRRSKDIKEGASLDLSVTIKDFAEPVVLSGGVRVAGPRPRIRNANPSLPSDLQIALRPGELPAGVRIGIMMQVSAAGLEPAVTLKCNNANPVRVRAGMGSDAAKLNAMQADTLYLSLDPAIWPGGCVVTAVLESERSGVSEELELGRVVRLPRIDDFKLTDESGGEGTYVGILTGRDLELIGKTGWDAASGHAPLGLPTPIAGDGNKQSLRIRVPWPSPTPRSPLFVWFRGEQDGRATTVRY